MRSGIARRSPPRLRNRRRVVAGGAGCALVARSGQSSEPAGGDGERKSGNGCAQLLESSLQAASRGDLLPGEARPVARKLLDEEDASARHETALMLDFASVRWLPHIDHHRIDEGCPTDSGARHEPST